MTNSEMLELIREFKDFIRNKKEISPALYPAMDIILDTFFVWFADRKLKR